MEKVVNLVLLFALMNSMQLKCAADSNITKLPEQCYSLTLECVHCDFEDLKEEVKFPFLRSKLIHFVVLDWTNTCRDRTLLELPDNAFSNMSNVLMLAVIGCVKHHFTSRTFQGLDQLSTLDIFAVPTRGYFATFDSDWLKPLTSLRKLTLIGTHALGFPVGHFCQLPHLEHLSLSKARIHSSVGLGIQQNDSSASMGEPCLPNLEHLDISFNLIQILNVSFSTDIPNLKVLKAHSNSISQMIGLNSETFIGLQELNLSNNNLSRLTLENPEKCNNSTMKHLDLHDNHLRYILPGLFICSSHLKYLNMAGNRLNETTLLEAGLHHLTELEYLNINGNNISVLQSKMIGNMTDIAEFSCMLCGIRFVEKDVFLRWKNITVLNFSSNFLEKIDIEGPISSLSELNLQHNSLQEIPMFSKIFPMLTSLDLSSNEIKEFTISAMFQLKYLQLANNKISYLAQNSFLILPKLELLDLSNNAIQYIEPGAFHSIQLLHLNLDFNNITDIGQVLFILFELTHLHLRGNRLRELHTTAFTDIKWIDMSLNQISYIEYGTFLKPKLEFLNLTHNKLYHFPTDLLYSTEGVRPEVYLEGNYLHCECNDTIFKYLAYDR